MSYNVIDRDGNPVAKGTRITDFRGNPAWFVSVSRGPEYNGTAMVITVRDEDDLTDPFRGRESYAQVFDLTVSPNP